MGSRYPAHELDEIRDWAYDIAGEPVPLKRAIKMWEARQDAVRRLRTQERAAQVGLRVVSSNDVTPLGRHAA